MKADMPPTYNDSLAESFTSQGEFTPLGSPILRVHHPAEATQPSLHPRTDIEVPQHPLSLPSSEYQCSSNLSQSSTLPLEQPRCALLPGYPATYLTKSISPSTSTALSPLAATILIHAYLLTAKDLTLYTSTPLVPMDRIPSDPITGALSATSNTVGNILMGVADYPIEIARVAQQETMQGKKGAAVDFAMDGGKGISRIVGAGLKAPMDITLGLSRGFGNLPRGWGDETVRKEERVGGVKSGIVAGGKGLGLGLYDGITGIFTQPVRGAMKGGVLGGLKGVGMGIGGVVCKPAAGVIGLPAYAMKGVHEEIRKKRGFNVEEHILATLLAQGEEEWALSTDEQRSLVLGRWKEVNAGYGRSMGLKYQ